MKKKIISPAGRSSGNVFQDLGFCNPEEELAKADLAIQINSLIKKKNLNQTQAAKLLGVDQPKISQLALGKLSGFSLERLFRFINLLGKDISIDIVNRKPKNKSRVIVNIKQPQQPKKTMRTPRLRPSESNVVPISAKKKSRSE